MKRAGTKSAFDEALAFARDPRPYPEKERDYLRKQNLAEPVDMVGMVKRIAFINK